MGGAVNSFTVADPAGNDIDEDTGFIGSAGIAPSDLFSGYFSFIYTEEGDTIDRTMLNGIVSGGIPMGNDATLNYVMEGNWREDDIDGGGTNDMWNVTGYLKSAFGPISVAGRADYTDDDSIVTGVNTSMWSLTLTGGYTIVDGVIVRLEYRHDDADDDVFNDDDGIDDSLDTLQAQLMWVPEV
jgi:hypothetical protein